MTASLTSARKESAIDAQDFEAAANLRDKEKTLIAEKAQREREWKAGDMDIVAEVDERLIAEVLALMTGIPVTDLSEDDTQRLLRMEDELHRRVIGQEQAVKALSKSIRRTRAGLKDPKRPSGRSSSRAPRVSARRNCPRRWPSSCSATRMR